MADEFQNIGSGNWWDSSRNRFESGGSPSSTALSSIGSFGWTTEIVDMKARPSIDSGSVAVSGSSSDAFQNAQKLQALHDSADASVLPHHHDPNLQIMGLGLPSQPMDWNQPLLRGGKGSESSTTFRSLLQIEDLSSNTSYHQQSDDQMASSSSVQINSRGFSLDQTHFSGDSSASCQGAATSSFQVDSGVYGSPSTMMQGVPFGGSDSQVAQQSGGSFDNRSMNLLYPPNYGGSSGEAVLASWSKFPHFMRSSPPKHPPLAHDLHFSNNAPFWNATAAAPNDASSAFFPPLHTQLPTQSFDEKPKNSTEVGDLGTVGKKGSSEASSKRPRSETPSTLPAFKVRKEKMGDRITALQQLVSPFGKTDTASVLTEAIEYIKFLHEQVSVLSAPYMKVGAPIQHNQNSEKPKEPEGPKQDLRSRGLCLVPVSSTFPVTHESTVDFWTPTFGGTFR